MPRVSIFVRATYDYDCQKEIVQGSIESAGIKIPLWRKRVVGGPVSSKYKKEKFGKSYDDLAR